jgi:GrpB-like predicted nucleotidyltransferase (UPF0157 family)
VAAVPTHLDAHLDEILIGGRERPPGDRLRIVDYDEGWPEAFARHRLRIATALGPAARAIEHIGSTSVPGLAAKPIIDILVAVDDPEDDACVGAMEASGYQLRVREPGHRMYRTPARDVHVHFWKADSAEVHRHLRFRDWLRVHPDDRQLYEQTKRTLAAQPWPDMNYYADAKGPVIAEITARASAQP